MAEYIKGIAFNNYKFFMSDVSSPTVGKTGLSPTVEIADDAGTFASALGSTIAIQSGWYIHSSIVTSEMNHDSLVFVAMASGANDWRDIIFPKIYSTTDIKSDTAAILEDTAVQLTAAQINSECNAVIVANDLDHLVKTGVSRPSNPASGSFIDIIMNKDGSQTFDRATDALEGIADTGAAGLTAAQVNSEMQAVFNTVIPSPTSGSPYGMLIDTFDETAIVTSRLTAARAGYLDNLNISENVAGISDISGLNDISVADVRSECTVAVVTYDAVVPADLPARFSDLSISSGFGRVSVNSVYVPIDITGTTMSSLTTQIFTDPLSKYESTTDRSLTWGIAKLTNKVCFNAADIEIKKSNDTDNLFTQASSVDATANPIVCLDTA